MWGNDAMFHAGDETVLKSAPQLCSRDVTGHCAPADFIAHARGCSMNPNPDLTKWLGMVWEALPEEDLAKRKGMLRDANAVLEQLRPEATLHLNTPTKSLTTDFSLVLGGLIALRAFPGGQREGQCYRLVGPCSLELVKHRRQLHLDLLQA